MAAQTSPPAHTTDHSIYVYAALGLFVSFGVTLGVFAIFYVQDLAMLAELPSLVWNFICGVPTESGATLPLLVLASLVSFVVAAAIGIGYYIRRRLAAH